MRFTVDVLRGLKLFEGLSEDQLEWFCEQGKKIELDTGEHMFERGQPADYMFVVVTGTIEGFEEVGGQWLAVATTGRGGVTGMLPFSRMTHYPRYTVAVEPSEVLRVDKGVFPEMLSISLEVGQRLVAEMSDRVRGDVRLEQQQEKMMALGKLAAGLAHERAEREEMLGAWLTDRGVADGWHLAGTFADSGLGLEDLESLSRNVPAPALGDALVWIECGLAAETVVAEIASSAERISSLIASVKTYSHMDRSVEHEPTDVREGLDNTLEMLRHELEKKGIQLARDYQEDLPKVPAHAGELNQVWTNLIDNAIDAAGEGGSLRIEASADETGIVVRVIDDGPGIPDDIRQRIFDPFFTTKEVGEGTGLGLDIARRIVRTHRGRIDVHSRPGRTEMRVHLPDATVLDGNG